MPSERQSQYHVALADIPETVLVPAKYLSGGSIGAQIAYGKEGSIMVATRQPGYHSKPHSHDAEQFNYVLEGELYIFVEDTGFLARKGDVFRIPRNLVHWSWVQGTTECVLLEVHTPALTGDPGVLDTATSMLTTDEEKSGFASVKSEWPENIDRDAVERKVLGASAA